MTAAAFFSALNGNIFVESDPQATGTAFLFSPGAHCSVLEDSEVESGSCGVGWGSLVFWGALARTILKKHLSAYWQESLLGSEGHIHLDGVPVGSVHTIHQAPCELSFVDLERKLSSKSFKVDVTFLFVRDYLCLSGEQGRPSPCPMHDVPCN